MYSVCGVWCNAIDWDTELILVTLIFFMADIGFGLCKLQILETVKSLLVEEAMAHIFKDGVPTDRWHYMFLGRHTCLFTRLASGMP